MTFVDQDYMVRKCLLCEKIVSPHAQGCPMLKCKNYMDHRFHPECISVYLDSFPFPQIDPTGEDTQRYVICPLCNPHLKGVKLLFCPFKCAVDHADVVNAHWLSEHMPEECSECGETVLRHLMVNHLARDCGETVGMACPTSASGDCRINIAPDIFALCGRRGADDCEALEIDHACKGILRCETPKCGKPFLRQKDLASHWALKSHFPTRRSLRSETKQRQCFLRSISICKGKRVKRIPVGSDWMADLDDCLFLSSIWEKEREQENSSSGAEEDEDEDDDDEDEEEEE